MDKKGNYLSKKSVRNYIIFISLGLILIATIVIISVVVSKSSDENEENST